MIRSFLSTVVLLGLGSGSAIAQAVQPSSADEDNIVVVGSRGTPRLRTDTSAPVDVLSGETLQDKGYESLSRILEALSPSFNYAPAANSPSAEGTRPATLRGLTPDQVLVLVNGHRRHAVATINTNNGVGRGTVPVDFNTIPVAAIKRIEILRDGAAAQYGSDAIAGVINIVLRDDAEGGYAAAQSGISSRGDAATYTAALRHGFALGSGGFLTLTGELRSRGDFNRAGIDPRFGRITQRLADPITFDANLAANGEVALGAATTLYLDATFAHRDTKSSPLFRLPNVAPQVYPNGFLPVIRQKTLDLGGTIGLRGALGDWGWDLSDTAGYDRANFRVTDTTNTSLGTASPTAFDGGGQRYFQNIANLTVGRPFAVLAGAHLSIGVEHRYESYAIRKGEPASFEGAGAQGIPGYNPPAPVNVNRNAISAFIDAELKPVPQLTLGAAGRFEHYSDFGSKVTGKASLFWRPVPFVALRGTISTGFRAPSLQQQSFSTVTSQLSNGILVNVGNFAVGDPVSVALGASPLKPETSTSYSAGVVLTPMPGLDLSLDVYRIDIDNRITFSESLTGAAVTAILRAHGITNASQVRFFTNAADTRSQGIEATLHWSSGSRAKGLFDVTLAYGAFDNDLTRLQVNPILPTLPLLGQTSIGVLVDSQPLSKASASLGFTFGPARLSTDIVHFGAFRAAPLGTVQRFGATTTADIEASVEIAEQARFAIGVLNLTDAFPDKVIGQADGRLYSEGGGLGLVGRQFYARFSARF